jgi:predicted permease
VDVYAYRPEPQPMSLGGRGEAERIYGALVTANYFSILGTQPAAGRLLQDSDDRAGSDLMTVLSDDLWQRRFGGDRAIIGQSITLNGHAFAVIGIAPPGFQGTTVLKPDLWVPMSSLSAAVPRINPNISTSRRSVWLVIAGRLRDGFAIGQANAELNAIGSALEREYPDENRGKNFRVEPSAIVPGQIQVVAGFLALLGATVGLVLLIACVNVAGMLLARAAARRREIAVRLAMGAGRSRLVRQLLTETTLLFAAGGAIALLLTKWLTAVLLAIIPELPVPVGLTIGTDWRVVGFAVALSAIAAILSGLAPALQASRADLLPALKADGPNGGSSRLRLRNAFVVGQVAMSLLLVIAGGLFLRALQRASAIEPGFDQDRVDVVSFDLSLGGYTAETAPTFMRELIARTLVLPGVESAGAAADLPLDGGRMGMGGVKVAGVAPPTGQEFLSPDWNVVAPGQFRTLKLPLVTGRDFTDADTATSLRVAIVNETLARQYWPGQDPIGKQMEVEHAAATPVVLLTVVGVAKDAHLMSLNAPAEPYLYVPFAQQFLPRISLLVRSRTDASVIPQIRSLVRQLNPNMPVTQTMALSQVTAVGLIPQRIAASVASSLGIVGLLLAAIGIYGVTSYGVSRRTREIGIRIALGADRARVMTLVLRQGFVLAAIGVAIGIAMAAAGSTLLESLLYGVRGLDPITFAGACVLFAAVTLTATYIPARRATRVDPIAALRNE